MLSPEKTIQNTIEAIDSFKRWGDLDEYVCFQYINSGLEAQQAVIDGLVAKGYDAQLGEAKGEIVIYFQKGE